MKRIETAATPKRFTIAEYHRLTEIGFFAEDDRVELIRGEINKMAAKGTAHTTCCRNLLRELAELVVGYAELQCQDPISLPSGSEPEPDFVIVRPRSDNYLSGHPTPENILLVIEIAESSLEYDREVKRSLYAEAGITHYWIFNLIEQCLEVYSEPYQNGDVFNYAVRRIVLPKGTIALPEFSGLESNGLSDRSRLELLLVKIFPGAV
ncbi:MAG: Uma2 family endonuclease [Tildeniella nuda ZEHNDER 1965/U140]|jgi:Uma2 family endonuclease|nr:Uma2 family endonuclease [Tildeniella nuda ZEHNDER 1965/U140]